MNTREVDFTKEANKAIELIDAEIVMQTNRLAFEGYRFGPFSLFRRQMPSKLVLQSQIDHLNALKSKIEASQEIVSDDLSNANVVRFMQLQDDINDNVASMYADQYSAQFSASIQFLVAGLMIAGMVALAVFALPVAFGVASLGLVIAGLIGFNALLEGVTELAKSARLPTDGASRALDLSTEMGDRIDQFQLEQNRMAMPS